MSAVAEGPSRASALVATLRRQGIVDETVLAAIERTDRALFVPSTFADHAWDNVALPIGSGQTISQPAVVAMMTEALETNDRHNVLEIGTGSGYQAAILSLICRRVFTIERHRDLLRDAERLFARLNLRNIVARFGDGSKGWPESAPFDRILFTAAAPTLPAALVAQLAPDGIMVGPIGDVRRVQTLMRYRRREDGSMDHEDLGRVRFVPLVPGLPRRPAEVGA
ncbi:MAG TPA: protein-L-isoaspartate(D-aspartate) O-methyltransferase [Stellaceae bacterium]|nr:protein-L-isoaspartate(D-aspartate) O-methyltransferase [Stellaceae bacterium]